MTQKLSVALATYNEEANLARCLESVKNMADEVVIVDGSSTDKTREIARSFGAKVTKTTNKPIFHINKQRAVDLCTSDWILALDADEEVSYELAKEIKQLIISNETAIRERRLLVSDPQLRRQWRLFDRHQALLESRDGTFDQDAEETVAFFVPRLNIFLGHPMRYSGVYPDGVIRLFKKGKARFPANSVHEQLAVDGRVDWLVNDLLHHDSPTFAKYLLRANRYTNLTAQALVEAQVPLNLVTGLKYFIWKPLVTFGQLYGRKGFLDGVAGLVFALMSGAHWAVAYMKYWEIKRVRA